MNFNELEKHLKFQFIVRIIIYILIALCFFVSLFAILITPTKAAVTHEYDITNTIWSTSDCEVTETHLGYFCAADSNVTNDLWSKVHVGSSYSAGNNVLTISFKAKTSMLPNSNHTIELHGMRYNRVTYSCSSNLVSCSVSYVSTTQLNINFSTGANGISSNGVAFDIQAYPNTFNGSNLFYISQFKLLSSEIESSGGGSSSGFDDTGIISNANQNTTEIINNQNENTQQITNSISSLMNAQNLIAADDLQQQRTQLESMCKNSYSVSLTKGGVISGTSVVANSQGFYSDYINVGLRGQTISRVCVANTYQGNTPNQYLIFYDSNKNVLQTNYSNVACRNLPSGTQYFRVGTYYPGIVITASNYCVTAEDQVYDYLKDDTNPSVNESGIDNVISDVQVQDPLNYLLTLPLNLLTKLNTLISSGTCQKASFGSLYGTELYLPCINFENYLGTI